MDQPPQQDNPQEEEPSGHPSGQTSDQPAGQTSDQPSEQISGQTSDQPSGQTSDQRSGQPSGQTSDQPSEQTSGQTSDQPSGQTSDQPSGHTSQAAGQTSDQPSEKTSGQTSDQPSGQPSGQTSDQPSGHTSQAAGQTSDQPSEKTSGQTSDQPSGQPSGQTSDQPSGHTSGQTSDQPSRHTSQAAGQTSDQPSGQLIVVTSWTENLGNQPSGQTSDQPSGQPAGKQSDQPSGQPAGKQSDQPSGQPSGKKSGQPSGQPSGKQSDQPSGQPSGKQSDQPSGQPSGKQSDQPSGQPSGKQFDQPSGQPSGKQSDQPSGQPSGKQSDQPSGQPSGKQSDQPSGQPSGKQSDQPSGQPSGKQSDQPSGQPSGKQSDPPSGQPSGKQSYQPLGQPFQQPSRCPSGEPSGEPSEHLFREHSEDAYPDLPLNDSSKSSEQEIIKYFKVTFFLHVQKFHADNVAIQFNQRDKCYSLTHVKKTDDGDLWWMVYSFNVNDIGICYRYVVSWYERYRIWSSLFSKQWRQETEVQQRTAEATIQYDTFHSPIDNKYLEESLPKSSIVYIKWLFDNMDKSRIKQTLIQIEKMHFQFALTCLEPIVAWILERARGAKANDVQRLYLCIFLGHLAKSNPNIFSLPSGKSTKVSSNRLLQSLENCSRLNLLPSSSLELLKTLAPHLVNSCSNPGWLMYAAYFYPYFGVEYVVHQRLSMQKCDPSKFWDLVILLLPVLKINDETREVHRRFLRRMLDAAPAHDAVMALYESDNLASFFVSSTDKEDFFSEFFQDSFRSCSKRVNPGENLVDLSRIPKKLLSKMHEVVYTLLLYFSKSTDDPKNEHTKAFWELMNLNSCFLLSTKELESILSVLSCSSVPLLHGLLLDLLNVKKFQSHWQELPFQKKVDICCVWIVTTLKKTQSISNAANNLLPIYRALEELMSRSLNATDKALANAICQKIMKPMENGAAFLEAYKSIEKYHTDIIQECYKHHIRFLLHQDSSLIRKAVAEVDKPGSSSSKSSNAPSLSRLGEDMLLYVLEVIEVTEPKEDADRENDFRAMLKWSDVWKTLLKAKGNVTKLHKDWRFQVGKQNWQVLASNIKNGKLSLEFLNEVEQQKEIISFICATVLTEPNITEGELLEKEQEFTTRIYKLAKTQKDGIKKFEILKLLIHYIEKLSEEVYPIHGISGRDELILEFHQCSQKWKTQKRLEDWNNDSWGILLPLLKPAKTLEPLISSMSFRNFAKICLQEIHADPSSVEDERIHDFHLLAQFLSNKVVERFSSQWNPVMSNPGSLPVKTVKVLLEGLDSEESLEKEFGFLKDYFRREFSSDVTRYIKCYVKYPSVLKQVRYLLVLLDTFQLNDPLQDKLCSILKSFESLEDDSELTLEPLSQKMDNLKKVMNGLSGDEIEAVIEELGRSNELIEFVTEIVDEDIRFLIDAVEEHPDQFVSVASVSNLINVHGFLAPLIKRCKKGCDAQQFFLTLKRSSKVYQDIAVKFRECSANVNTLKGLYNSVSNREEITKEIIASCLKEDEYLVSLTLDGVCQVQISYARKDQKKSVNHFLPDLHDLRSRAHLIVNSDNKASLPVIKDADIDFSKFINQINLLTEITVLLSQLQSSGYVKYRKFWKRMKGNTLEDEKGTLEKELKKWERILSCERKISYFLNYYRSDQLCVLYDFLARRDYQVKSEDVLSLIHFVDLSITKEQLEGHRNTCQISQQDISSEDPREMISSVGDALDNVFAKTRPVVRSMFKLTNDEKYPILSSASKIHATVQPGELFVANLQEESQLTANVMLTLYENTSNAFPEPYQVVFCTPQTTWEEIHLILQRCFAQSENPKYNTCSLFCIANVELLANEIQFKLVKVVKEFQNDSYSEYRLALICRGGNHNHIVEQFSQYAHHIAGMSDSALSERLVSAWPEVSMITSALPGLGKTERIKEEAIKSKKNIITFPISGPLDQIKLVQRLKDLKLKKYHCLHLDVGDVNDPLLLDIFLFQLIVIGMVSSGKQFYHLPTKHVFIEVSNTLKDNLRDSLVICKYFTRVHLQWKSYDNLVVSSEVTSNIQVVCQYFDAYNRACLESEDIHFTGPQKVKPLPANRCRELLAEHFSSNADITFTVLKTFLAVLADQLLKFSRSSFFKVAHLKSMLDIQSHGVRTNLFQALIKVSKEFASRSIATCHRIHSHILSQEESSEALDTPISTKAMSAQNMVERVDGMIQWKDSNHLLVVFHGISSQTITAVYRNKSLVTANVENLLTSQAVKGNNKILDDFKVMTQDQLQEKLERIVCTKPVKKDEDSPVFLNYALTPDNILKMILIILRVRAHVPVIIMGETGCGKTSLVRYLAKTCQIPFETFNFHAGITSEEVVDFIDEIEKNAIEKSQQIWVLLDEINTCDHLGLISEIMCHHALLGRPLSKNLVFLAACNPYKLRPKEHIRTAGLEGKNITDEYSKLVYRVYPLPEAMLDYVWDYGSLAPKDEKAYIERMVKASQSKRNGLLVDVIAESQNFIRKTEKNGFCVSLRDVYRCILLIKWFMEMIEKRKSGAPKRKQTNFLSHLHQYSQMSEGYERNPLVKSTVLALAHCYQSRLPTSDLRRRYRQSMMQLFTNHGITMNTKQKTDNFAAIVRMEEEDYLNRMELPSGTAKNAALRENVFVMLVCILNRIPIFVVGKPGCSKSLSMQLIRSNLRGRDSKDLLFRKLPQLYVISHQGSESSSSEGIIKVFEKARKYNQGENVLPVVLLDEVGLAENSKHNPLKVLHSQLEPEGGQLPDVAVVGISNWSLDAAKMNRAIHLSRPDPDEDDLFETGQSLLHTHCTSKGNWKHRIGKKELQCLAKGYFQYQSKQRYTNYHGLRDYYSLIKSLSLREDIDLQKIEMALQRNFGGIPDELTNIQEIFLDTLKKLTLNSSSGDGVVPVNKLIQQNLADPLARHLMLITNGDSAIGILNQNLAQLNRDVFEMFGSRFEEDLSEEYKYRMLSRIILCMERNCILILRDLESIYGSLYDMLNQNYAVVGKRKHCRVALGANSNPLCRVNDGFRCIVLTDRQKVNYSDPPFLNRFEKQLLRFSDVLDTRQQAIIHSLGTWVKEISTIQDHESRFNETDMFIGYHENTLPSLVLLHGKNPEDANEEIIKKCKDDLMWIAAPDGVLRARMSARQLKHDSSEVNYLSDEYFQKPIHNGLATFIEASTNEESPTFLGDEIGVKTIVMTFSNIHTDIQKCLGGNVKCQVERLGAYKSEKQFTETVNHFWATHEAKLLVLQCKPELDAEHMLLARSIIEEKRTAHQQVFQERGEKRRKHVCIIVHMQREATTNLTWQFNFLCGWKQVFLDVLVAPMVPLNEILSSNITDLLSSTIWPLRKIAQDVLLWCFTCIKYKRQQRPLNSILNIVKNLFESKKVYTTIERLVVQWIKAHEEMENAVTGFREGWQVKIACDRQALVNCSTLSSAMKHHVSQLVRQPLAKITYFLEKENAWPLHVFSQWDDGVSKTAYEEMWCELVLREDIFKLAEIPEPLGAESYTLDGGNLQLHLPFSQLLINRIDGVKDLFLEDHAQLKENEDNVDEAGQLIPSIQLQQMTRYSNIISKLVPEIEEFPPNSFNSYMNDLFDLTSKDFNPKMNRQQRVSTIKAAYVSQVKQRAQGKNTLHFYVQLHAFVWIHKEQIVDLLRMVVSCLPFVHQDVSARLTNEFLLSHSDVLTPNNDVISIPGKVKNDEEGYFEDKSEALRQPGLQGNMAGEENNNAMPVKHQAEDECFADILVTKYCEKMLPSKDTVEKNGGLESWMRNSCLLLSLASNISDQNTAFHFLRLTVDLARIIISLPEKEVLCSLCILNEIGLILQPKYLDAEKCFEKINEDLIKHLQEEVKPKFSSLFYGRCIDTNADAYSVPTIVEHVLSIDQADMVLMMGPVMLRLLMIEESESGIFTDIISEPSAIKDYPCLLAIDQGLKNLSSTGAIHCDSYAAVMICDQIQSLLKELSIKDFNSSDSRMLICMRNAANILSDATNCGLSLLSAVAFLRLFFSFMSRFIAAESSTTNILKRDSKYTILMMDINYILTNAVHDDDRRSSLQLFFLKQLRHYNSLFDLRKLCCESEKLPAVKTVWSSKKTVDKAKLISACKLDEYHQVKSAYSKLMDNKDEMLAFLKQCHQSSNHRLALLGILVNMIYLKRAERKLTDNEECLVRWFGENFEQFSSPLKDLLLRIIGKKVFKSSHLQLSPESSVDEVETALLILHISCVITSGIEGGAVTSPLYQYFTNPLACQNTFILALGEERKQQTLEKREVVSGPSPFTCECGLRTMFKDYQQDNKCPNCGQTHQPGASKCTSNHGDTPSSATKGYSSVPRQESSQSKWDTCMDHMNPSVFRALHIIVHASLYAGVAVELTNIADLSLMLRLEKDSSSEEDDKCPDPWPQQFLFRQVANDLQNLGVILAAKKEIILTVMHLVVERCTDLIRGTVNGTACSSVEERREWEIKFSNTADTLLKEARAPTTLKKAMRTQLKWENNSPEDEIEELDEYPSDRDKQNRQMKRLFRVTREFTFEDFRANFTNCPKNFQQRHRFLLLFFAQFDNLHLISDLYHLLKWARLVSSTLSYRISRKNVHLLSVDAFIHGQLGDLKLNRTEDEKKILKELFSSFKKAWNNMRSLVNQTLGPENKIMPPLTERNEIAYCVIETDCGVYLLTALKILSSLQNTILDELIFLSAVHHHPALSFLEKNANCSGVPSVSLQEAKEKGIIGFRWSKESNEVFKYSQKNPKYCKGEEIHYDFEQIEITMAKVLALGKCHLIVSFNKFIFENEFFHSCGPLLSEIRELHVHPQLSLPDDVCQGLETLKECSIKQAQDLLQQLEVLIFLLKRVDKCDVDMTLESFAEEWLSMLPSPFPASLLPQPSKSIKLKHITALYEAVEDMLADGVIGGIPDQFRDNLTDEVKDQLDVLVGDENKLSLQAFIKALRRFVVRYLSSEKFLPESKIALSSCLKEPSLWSSCSKQPDLEVLFPKELTLAYLHSTITHLQNLEKERKCNTEQSAQQPGPARKSTVRIRGGRRTKKF